MSNPPDLIDEDGNINVHTREGVELPLILQDANGAQLDLSARPLSFEIKGIGPIVVGPHDIDPLGRMIVIPREIVARLPRGNPPEFVLLDLSKIEPFAAWEGVIRRRGW